MKTHKIYQSIGQLKFHTLPMVVFFILICEYGSSQSYLPILQNNLELEFRGCHLIFDGYDEFSHSKLGDTIINEKVYSIIGDNNYQGFLRQNENNSKAWFKEPNKQEKLIMDLNLQLGDSIFIDCEMYGRKYSKVISVDTINQRKIITLDYIYPKILATTTDTIIYRNLKFIEGVGTNAYFLYQIEDLDFHIYGFVLGSKLVENNIEFIEFDQCNELLNVSTDEIKIPSINIHPNPASNHVYIQFDNVQEIQKMTLYDNRGNEVLSKSIISKKTKIDLSYINHGIYYLKTITKNGNVFKKLVILK